MSTFSCLNVCSIRPYNSFSNAANNPVTGLPARFSAKAILLDIGYKAAFSTPRFATNVTHMPQPLFARFD